MEGGGRGAVVAAVAGRRSAVADAVKWRRARSI